MSEHDDQPTAPVPPPREMTPDLPPAPSTRRRTRNDGRFGGTPTTLGPRELFAVGVSGQVRRHPVA